ncbi:MAG: cupin domain-containing protein [Solirubrobacterales bacterium]
MDATDPPVPAKFTDLTKLRPVEIGAELSIRALTGARVQVVHSEVQPGAEFAPHQHPHEQIVVVLDGAIEFEIDGERQVLGPMGAFYFAPGSLHGARVPGDRPAILLEVFGPPREDYRDGVSDADHGHPR